MLGNRELASALLANASCFICLLDRKGRYLYINRALEELSLERLLGRPLTEHLAPEYHAIFRRSLAAVFDKGESASYETRGLGPGGTEVWYESRLAPFRVNGEIKAALVTSLEISGHVRAREEVRANQQRYQDIFTCSRDAISYVSLDGLLLDVNPAYSVLTGYSREELVNTRRYQDQTPKEHQAADRLQAERLLKTGQTAEFEKELRRKDGSIVPVQMTVFLVKDKSGRAAAFGAIIRDMTERKARERRIIEAAEAERARLGLDLHDGLGQNLTGVALLAGALSARLGARDGAKEARDAKRIARLASDSVEQAKLLAQGLLPVGLDSQSLRDALRLLCARAKKLLGVRCVLRASGPVITDKTLSIQLYRIAQEAIHNAARHGGAKNVSVSLKTNSRPLVLSILDDGVGIDLSAKKGLGLRSMRDRTRLIGGVLEIKRRGRRGTAVICRV